MYTFIQLSPGTNPKIIESKLSAIVNKNRPGLKEAHEAQTMTLQSLKDIHLNSDLENEPESNGNANIVFFITLIGIFVLVIAWINYINLSTARAMGRAKEVGIRKVIGAHKYQLIVQFITESALVNLFSLFIAAIIVLLVLPYFNKISGLSLDFSYLSHPWFIGLLFLLWFTGTLLSGFYPAWVLSSFKPISVLKGKLKIASSGILLRKGLVIAQFMASVALISGTLIIYRQLHYMMSKNLGVNINQVVVMDRPGIALKNEENYKAYDHAIDVFRDELKKSPDIEAASTSLTIPGHQRAFKVTIKPYGGNSKDSVFLRVNSMDYDFLNVYKMNIVAGRRFSKEFPHDPDTSVILTESAVRLMGYENPNDAIGKTIVITEFNNARQLIAGVVNDYHQVSLKKPIEPTMFFCSPYDGEYYSIRINTDHLPKTLEHIQASWAKAFPGNPFEYSFLDEYFNQQYNNERRFGELFTTFSALAIIISCLGLFGLSAFTASQRIKEIGIRKVLGASVANIAAMLSKDFLKLVLISIAITSPLAWFTMEVWLRNFAYRIDVSWWVFAVAGIVALLIALLTVSFQAIKAALTNPVKSLRTE
jgi:putative ABC transport system permease protein